MNKFEILTLRKLIADAEFVEDITIQLNTINLRFAEETSNIERIAQTLEDYELLSNALWEAYEHEVQTLKDLCIKHNIDKGTMFKLFRGGVHND